MNDLVINKKIDPIGTAIALTGISDRTRETYHMAMRSYSNFVEENKLGMDLDSLKNWIKSANKPSTQALRTAAARKVFGEMYKGHPQLQELKEAIAEIKVVKMTHEVSESKYVTSAELDQIVSASSQRIGIMIKTLFMTGVRISELLSMRYDACVAIRDSAVFEITVIGKRSKMHKVYITKALMSEIVGVFGNTEYLFEHEGRRYDRKYITEQIKKAGKTIGKNISAHSIRHSFAQKLLDKGVSIDKISKSLCHSSTSTTADFYLHGKASLEDLGVI